MPCNIIWVLAGTERAWGWLRIRARSGKVTGLRGLLIGRREEPGGSGGSEGLRVEEQESEMVKASSSAAWMEVLEEEWSGGDRLQTCTGCT